MHVRLEKARSRAQKLQPSLLPALLAITAGCATLPASRYGVDSIEFAGVEEMDEDDLRDALATDERGWWGDWPLYDRSVFERDLQRIERWYRARGYYDATIASVSYDPPGAVLDDRVDDNDECERVDDGEGCAINIGVTIEEGSPVRIAAVELSGLDELNADVQETVGGSIELSVGQRFDETHYEQAKASLVRQLHDQSYACAAVEGHVVIDPDQHVARVDLSVDPGERHVIGDVTLEGEQDLRRATILATADIDEGDEFTDQLLAEARHAVYALGAFASVDVVGTPRRDDAGECTGIVDVAVRVTPGRRFRYGLGGGLQSGNVGTGLTQQDVNQWDLHLLGFIEHRNFLGGLRRIRIEERPKLIFSNAFPRPTITLPADPATGTPEQTIGPRLGNELRLEFRQPAFIEARTTGVVTARWDYGPDPIQGFFRHNIDAAFSVRRNFFDGRVHAAVGVHYNLFLADDIASRVTQSDYQVFFFEQQLVVDLRDDTRNPRLGVYFGVDLQQAAFLDWTYFRVVPDVRGYVPLGPLTFAARFRLGWMNVLEASSDLDAVSSVVGPQPYRLRAGGSSSHRGFLPSFLGDEETIDGVLFEANDGGIRRWEASAELRIPFSEDFGGVLFADMGDVNRSDTFRFRNIRLAIGLGLRYQTLVGPFRFDLGWLVPGAQRVGDDADISAGRCILGAKDGVCRLSDGFRGAIHLTIGEAF